ncbi:C40 family peptidase [Sinomicrobium weinanense]|uniref:C40 family peptidase n=1 Tax=Sinomicrobium weinanense TaxID=2842200 RepID=A0A926JV48_9FLAO|nr:C40 family peptidase [Sinomicrobium weinanense]MBC9797736.1 C40 family peptidase [Sinomicrobium weinanense]MBU3123627.1 C40 family peptidase [Sinomicrobium weinanense]
MRRICFILCLLLSFGACKSRKKALSKKPRIVTVEGSPATKAVHVEVWPSDRAEEDNKSANNTQVNQIIKTAISYNGTKYRYGGTTRKGMDCSGLVYTSFKEHNIALQRASYMMATQGERIKLKKVQKGDLLFFKTGRRNRINHVGLVVEVKGNNIRFIHSTTSRGVLVSSLREGYWNHAFIEARRIL